jgi:hypothetical protein
MDSIGLLLYAHIKNFNRNCLFIRLKFNQNSNSKGKVWLKVHKQTAVMELIF